MYSFIAVSWDPGDLRAAGASREFLSTLRGITSCHSSSDGFYLADLSNTGRRNVIVPCGRSGAVYGTLFRRSASLSPSSALDQLSEEEAAAIQRSSGANLLHHYWGNYVAFIQAGNCLHVVSDPASSIPCFYSIIDQVTFIFSHLEKCPATLRRGRTLNKSFIRQVLAYDKIQNGETGISGVRELMSGKRLQIKKADVEELPAWDPRQVAQNHVASPAPEAAAELRRLIRYVVVSHAMAEPKITLRLSGGLDSAIVAASLRSGARHLDLNAVHYVLEGGDPSEAGFARSVAECIGIDLTYLPVDPAMPLPNAHQCPPTARPFREFLGQNQLTKECALPALSGRTLFTGQGGDHLFQEVRSSLGFGDYLQLNGLRPDAVGELVNAARLSEQSVWRVLRETMASAIYCRNRISPFKAGLLRRRTSANRLAFADLRADDLVPVWAREPDGLPPAKFAQISSLVHMFQNRSAIYTPATPHVIHPLISQPLIEFCLRSPVYLLCAGGISRGLARLAMKHEVPDAVRLRRSKGDASRFYIQQIASNRNLLTETLLDGELVAGGYIERGEIRSFLLPETFRLQTLSQMVLVYYVIECWLQRWKSELTAA